MKPMAQKPKRQCYDIRFKLEVVAFAKKHGNREAARCYGPPPTEKMVRSWRKQEQQLKAAKPCRHNLRKGISPWPELEEELKTWMADQRSLGIKLSTKMIIDHSRQIARNRDMDDFRGSQSWCSKFLRRNDLSLRTRTRIAHEIPSEFENKIIHFCRNREKRSRKKEKKYESHTEESYFDVLRMSPSDGAVDETVDLKPDIRMNVSNNELSKRNSNISERTSRTDLLNTEMSLLCTALTEKDSEFVSEYDFNHSHFSSENEKCADDSLQDLRIDMLEQSQSSPACKEEEFKSIPERDTEVICEENSLKGCYCHAGLSSVEEHCSELIKLRQEISFLRTKYEIEIKKNNNLQQKNDELQQRNKHLHQSLDIHRKEIRGCCVSPDFISSVFCCKTSLQKDTQELQRHNICQLRKQKIEAKQSDAAESSLHPSGSLPTASTSTSCDVNSPDDCSSDTDTCSITSGMLDYNAVHNTEIDESLNQECQNLRKEFLEYTSQFKHSDLDEESLRDEEKVKRYTGLPSFTVVMAVVQLISPSIKRKCLSPFQQLLLTLMKLRLNLQFKDLGYRFKIHCATASRIFSDLIDILYIKLVPITLFWPQREARKTMPKSFRETLPKCIGIIDCFEIFVERSDDLKAKAQALSDYKSHNTIKYIIAIAPQGSITYISKGLGGHTSEICNAERSGLLKNLFPGDVLLADRGFDLNDSVALYQCKVEISAFTRDKKHLSKMEIQNTRELASQSIHIERVIGILKNKYTLLQDTLPIEVLQKDPVMNMTSLDKYVQVACALVNMCPSIVPFE